MARATVEIDMPVCCAACPLSHDYICLPMNKDVTTDILWKDREKWCPLKEVESAGEVTDECNGDACPIRFSGDR